MVVVYFLGNFRFDLSTPCKFDQLSLQIFCVHFHHQNIHKILHSIIIGLELVSARSACVLKPVCESNPFERGNHTLKTTQILEKCGSGAHPDGSGAGAGPSPERTGSLSPQG